MAINKTKWSYDKKPHKIGIITLKDVIREYLALNNIKPKKMPEYLFITLPSWMTKINNRGMRTYIKELGYSYYYLFNQILIITKVKMIDYNKKEPNTNTI